MADVFTAQDAYEGIYSRAKKNPAGPEAQFLTKKYTEANGAQMDGRAVVREWAQKDPEFAKSLNDLGVKDLGGSTDAPPAHTMLGDAWESVKSAATVPIADRLGLRSAIPAAAATITGAHDSLTWKVLSSAYDTKLSPADEVKFQEWKKKYAPKDSGVDYDLRGAYQAGLTPDPKTGHWSDVYKKPNHETFSNESKYATSEAVVPPVVPSSFPLTGKDMAGHWEGDHFVPSRAQNMREMSAGVMEGLISKGMDLTSPVNAGGTALAFFSPLKRLGQGSKLFTLAKKMMAGGFSYSMLSDVASELPAAYEAYQSGDVRGAGKLAAQGLTDLVLGIQAGKSVKEMKTVPPGPKAVEIDVRAPKTPSFGEVRVQLSEAAGELGQALKKAGVEIDPRTAKPGELAAAVQKAQQSIADKATGNATEAVAPLQSVFSKFNTLRTTLRDMPATGTPRPAPAAAPATAPVATEPPPPSTALDVVRKPTGAPAEATPAPTPADARRFDKVPSDQLAERKLDLEKRIVEARGAKGRPADLDAHMRELRQIDTAMFARSPMETLVTERIRLAEDLNRTESIAAQNSQGVTKTGNGKTAATGGPALPTEAMQRIGDLRARLSMLNQVISARERFGAAGAPPPPATVPAAPAAAPLAPDVIAENHGFSTTERHSTWGGEQPVNLRDLASETVQALGKRIERLGLQRGSMTPNSPEAQQVERQLRALNELRTAKNARQVPPTQDIVPPRTVSGFRDAQDAGVPVSAVPKPVPPAAPPVQNVPPLRPGLPPATSEPVTPSSIGTRRDINKLAADTGVSVDDLRKAESASDAELVRGINKLHDMRKDVYAPPKGSPKVSADKRAKQIAYLDAHIKALTAISLSRQR